MTSATGNGVLSVKLALIGWAPGPPFLARQEPFDRLRTPPRPPHFWLVGRGPTLHRVVI